MSSDSQRKPLTGISRQRVAIFIAFERAFRTGGKSRWGTLPPTTISAVRISAARISDSRRKPLSGRSRQRLSVLVGGRRG
jgi:hypothetical protein